MSKNSLEMEIETALRSGTIPWIIIDSVRAAVTGWLEEHGDEGEGVPPEWVIDHLFTHYWADYPQMSRDEQIQSVRDELTRALAEAEALYSERDSQGS